jgi:hypothetical protein
MHRYAKIVSLVLVMSIAVIGAAMSIKKFVGQPDVVAACQAWIASRDAAPDKDKPGAFRIVSQSGACIDGEIDQDLYAQFQAWIDAAGPGAKPVLVVRSGGGDAYAAIDIAQALQDKDGAVFITDVCASSCANYLFSGIRKRHAIGTAVLLFHGGLPRSHAQDVAQDLASFLNSAEGAQAENPEEITRQMAEKAASYLKKQDALYASAGADPAIIYGFEGFELRDLDPESCAPAASDEADYAFFFSRDLIDQLGIAPLSGNLEDRASVINQRLGRSGGTSRACPAPARYFQPAQS